MLTSPRHSPLLAALALVAALAAAVPAPRWCALPWSAVTAECFAACETGADACAYPAHADGGGVGGACAAEAANGSCDAIACGVESSCDAPARERAFCPEPPLAATPGSAPADPGPPVALAVLPGAGEVPEPAPATALDLATDPPPPRERPRGLPPPVRGPPRLA